MYYKFEKKKILFYNTFGLEILLFLVIAFSSNDDVRHPKRMSL